MVKKSLRKIRDERMICGVCAGFSEYMDADVTLVRIFALLIVIFTFPIGLVAYFLACIIMPSETSAEVPSRDALEGMTKKEIREMAEEKYGIRLSTNDLKDEMIDQFLEEAS